MALPQYITTPEQYDKLVKRFTEGSYTPTSEGAGSYGFVIFKNPEPSPEVTELGERLAKAGVRVKEDDVIPTSRLYQGDITDLLVLLAFSANRPEEMGVHCWKEGTISFPIEVIPEEDWEGLRDTAYHWMEGWDTPDILSLPLIPDVKPNP